MILLRKHKTMNSRLGLTTFVGVARVVTGRSILGGSRVTGVNGEGGVKSTTVTCTPTYGFLPCTTGLWGELFLIVVYNYLTAVGSTYVSKGSDLFFHMFGTGIFGATVFQMLGTLPQMVIMLTSILTSDSDTQESMAAMIMAMLAGSTIFSLTIVWGSVIAFGSQQLISPSHHNSNLAINPSSSTTSTSSTSSSLNFDKILKKTFSSSYGVRTDEDTKVVARILIFESIIPFLILQLAEILTSSTAKRIVVLVTLIITVTLLLIYITYEIFKPWIQDKNYEYIIRKNMQHSLLQQYLTSSGKPNQALIKDLFHKIDKNSNSKISEAELYAFILGIQIEEVGLISTDEFSQKVMNEFDTSRDTHINETEFVQGISKWLTEALYDDFPSTNSKRGTSNSQRSREEQQSLISQSSNKKTVTTTTTKPSGKAWWNYTKAVFMILFGTGVMLLIGMPLMINVQGFATAANIPSFLISYVIIPLSMGYRQVLTAVSTARKKTVKDTSLSLAQVYNGVFMNNMLSLAIFLVIVYVKDISWDVSAEVLVVLLICTLMGFLSSFLTKFPFWIGGVFAYTLYPISILILYLLTEVFGW